MDCGNVFDTIHISFFFSIQAVSEPPFRLNIKRNYKGDYGFEYTVKGDNINELQLNDFEMQKYLFQQGLVSKEPKQPEFLKNP